LRPSLARRNLFPMLPGFRFLFAAIVLSMSVLVFGLGAAAVLRAAHEQFAESGSWRPAPDTSAAQQGELPGPMLAMLRVEPAAPRADTPVVTPSVQTAELAPSPEAANTAPPEAQAAAVAETAKADDLAVAKPEIVPDLPRAEDKGAQPEVAAAAAPAAADAVHPDTPTAQPAAKVEAPVTADATTAAAEPAPAPAAGPAAPAIPPPAPVDEPAAISTAASSEASPAAPEQAGAPAAAGPATARIATLGGPPVVIEDPVPQKAVRAGPDPNEVKKEKDKERAEERARRRRLAAARRAKQAREAAQAQQAANPFAPPNQGFQYMQPAQANASASTRTR